MYIKFVGNEKYHLKTTEFIFFQFSNFILCIVGMIFYFSIILPLRAEPLPDGLKRHPLETSNKPFTKSGITYFKIIDKICSPTVYPDGRGESDCKNGNVRSQLVGTPDARIGTTASYSFDIRLQPNLSYFGWYNESALSFLKSGRDSKFYLAVWEGNRIHNYIHMLKADTVEGITFLGKICQIPKDFGKWVHFSMEVKWTLKPDGKISVKCDDNILYESDNIATAVNPHCYITNHCEPGKIKKPDVIFFQIGANMAGRGMNWKENGQKSQFVGIQEDGIEVQVKNFKMNIK